MFDLASQHPEITERMATQWNEWAVRAKVLPWPWGAAPTKNDFRIGPKFELRFTKDNKTVSQKDLHDSSGMNNRFSMNGKIACENDGAVFDGSAWIEVEKSPALYCANTSWQVESKFISDTENAVVVSQGGSRHGYSLFIKEGKPGFAVRIDGKLHTVFGPEKIEGSTLLFGSITPDKKIVLAVGGKTVAEKQIDGFITDMPGEPLVVGADPAGTVFETRLPVFKGKLERVAVFRGVPPRAGNN